MKSSCRGEEADYPNNSIIKFGMILKMHRKEKEKTSLRDWKVWEVQHEVSTPSTEPGCSGSAGTFGQQVSYFIL